MRKLILIAAMALLATQANAGGSRSLSLAATSANERAEEPATTPATIPTAQTLATTAQPTATGTTTAPATTPAATPPAPQTAAPVTTTTEPAKPTVGTKPKHRDPTLEARVIRELHRHGIYW